MLSRHVAPLHPGLIALTAACASSGSGQLKGSEAAIYGFCGAHGMIVIKTKSPKPAK